MTAPSESTPAHACCLCGGMDAEMDAWLGICPACLARAGGRVQEEEQRWKREALPKVGGFRVLRHVGSGGMGGVYEAVREADGTRVALKLIALEMAADPRFRGQFQREGEALRRLNHPGVVRRLDAGEEGGRPWLAMEFIDGPDLRQVLRRGPLPVARALEIAAETAAALAAAHAVGIVHRDIKPANVLLNETGRVKVADFGMTRPQDAGGQTTDPLTLVPAAAGHYSAPELEKKGGGDARADIYSLGALLYHLLTGHAPRAQFHPARKERTQAGISKGVDRIITRCLKTAPAHRFQTMLELQKALEHERQRLAEPRSRIWQGCLSCVLLAVVCITAWTLYSEAAEAEKRRSISQRLSEPPSGWEPERHSNSLGMNFVSIPACEVLFCVWETRVRDYAAFAEPWPDPEAEWVGETGFAFPLKKPVFSLHQGEFKAAGRTWKNPGFITGPEHPVCGVSASDAMAFCTWLTWKERREGRLRMDQAYRLPTDAEWSMAAGLKPEPGDTPEQSAATWPEDLFPYPWGFRWPAPDYLYSVASDEVNDWQDWHPGWLHRPRRDGWRGTAPVTAMPADTRGLYHITGNVWEWTETPYNQGNEKHALVLRGGSWLDASRDALSLAARDRDLGTLRMTKRGFRVVFQKTGAQGWRYGAK